MSMFSHLLQKMFSNHHSSHHVVTCSLWTGEIFPEFSGTTASGPRKLIQQGQTWAPIDWVDQTYQNMWSNEPNAYHFGDSYCALLFFIEFPTFGRLHATSFFLWFWFFWTIFQVKQCEKSMSWAPLPQRWWRPGRLWRPNQTSPAPHVFHRFCILSPLYAL